MAQRGLFGSIKSFLLDSKDDRARYKAARDAGFDPEEHVAKANGKPTSAESKDASKDKTQPQERPSKVSRRARYSGGKRWIPMAFIGLFAAAVLLSVLALGVAIGKPGKNDVKSAVADQLHEQGQDFPTGQAVSWAGQVVVDWGTWDEDETDNHQIRMAQYLTNGMDNNAGWNGKGKQKVTFISTNPEPRVQDSNHALVDVDYRLDDNSRRCVSVPTYAYQPDGVTGDDPQWAFALSGNPIPRPCAPRTGAVEDKDGNDPTNQKGMSNNDKEARDLTTNFFPSFFAAWAGSDQSSLKQFTASGVSTTGLGGAMSSTPAPDIEEAKLFTPSDSDAKEGKVYTSRVKVNWNVAGSTSQVEATYDVPMKKQGDRWYVAGEPEPSAYTDDATSGNPGPDGGGAANSSDSPSASASSGG